MPSCFSKGAPLGGDELHLGAEIVALAVGGRHVARPVDGQRIVGDRAVGPADLLVVLVVPGVDVRIQQPPAAVQDDLVVVAMAVAAELGLAHDEEAGQALAVPVAGRFIGAEHGQPGLGQERAGRRRGGHHVPMVGGGVVQGPPEAQGGPAECQIPSARVAEKAIAPCRLREEPGIVRPRIEIVRDLQHALGRPHFVRLDGPRRRRPGGHLPGRVDQEQVAPGRGAAVTVVGDAKRAARHAALLGRKRQVDPPRKQFRKRVAVGGPPMVQVCPVIMFGRQRYGETRESDRVEEVFRRLVPGAVLDIALNDLMEASILLGIVASVALSGGQAAAGIVQAVVDQMPIAGHVTHHRHVPVLDPLHVPGLIARLGQVDLQPADVAEGIFDFPPLVFAEGVVDQVVHDGFRHPAVPLPTDVLVLQVLQAFHDVLPRRLGILRVARQRVHHGGGHARGDPPLIATVGIEHGISLDPLEGLAGPRILLDLGLHGNKLLPIEQQVGMADLRAGGGRRTRPRNREQQGPRDGTQRSECPAASHHSSPW